MQTEAWIVSLFGELDEDAMVQEMEELLQKAPDPAVAEGHRSEKIHAQDQIAAVESGASAAPDPKLAQTARSARGAASAAAGGTLKVQEARGSVLDRQEVEEEVVDAEEEEISFTGVTLPTPRQKLELDLSEQVTI